MGHGQPQADPRHASGPIPPRPVADTWRRRLGRSLRSVLRQGLALFGGARRGSVEAGTPIDRESVRSILVCRPNAKLGNTLLLSPLFAELHRLFPGASVDLVTSYPRAALLLRGTPGLRQVLQLSHRPAASPATWLRQVKTIRSREYDLAIDPTTRSMSGRSTLGLSRSRYRLGFTAKDQWLQLTHSCQIPAMEGHESLRPLPLLQSLELRPANPDPRDSIEHPPLMRLYFDDAERADARRLINAALKGRDVAGRRIVGYFTGAAGQKALPLTWWREYWKRFEELEPQIVPVEFLQFGQTERLDARHATLSIGDPKQMAAAMAQLDLFVSADTGPMHLASSTATPTIGLFRMSDMPRYAPRKPDDLALDVLDLEPAPVAELCVRHWKGVRS